MSLEDLKSINYRYRGQSIGEIARIVFNPKHDRTPKPNSGSAKKAKNREPVSGR